MEILGDVLMAIIGCLLMATLIIMAHSWLVWRKEMKLDEVINKLERLQIKNNSIELTRLISEHREGLTVPSPIIVKNLGTMNSWQNDAPAEYRNCVMGGHHPVKSNIGKSLNRYTCNICHMSWTVDSGG